MASDNDEETKHLLLFSKWTSPKSQFDYAKEQGIRAPNDEYHKNGHFRQK